MKKNPLDDLGTIAEATFQKEYSTLRPLLEAEARLQAQLARLDAQLQQSRNQSAETVGYCITGSDILWNGWESATRRHLNIELARLRAQKLSAMDKLRTAFGRKQALADLSAAQKTARRRALCKKL